MSWHPKNPGRNFRRTHKLLEAVAVAVADSQTDHYSPGTPAEAAEGSNLDLAPLMTDSLIEDIGAITTSREITP